MARFRSYKLLDEEIKMAARGAGALQSEAKYLQVPSFTRPNKTGV